MTIRVLAVGKLTEGYLKDGLADYSFRIRRHCNLELIEVLEQSGKCHDPREKEGQALMAKMAKLEEKLGSRYFRIALVPGSSTQFSSEELAKLLARKQNEGFSRFYFIIGGSDGLSASVQQCADLTLSFSALTFPHQLFRLLLWEQIYRCLKINSGQTYHK